MKNSSRVLAFWGAILMAHLTVAAEERRIEARDLVITLGDQVTILKNGALGMDYFPDESIGRIPDENKLRLLLASRDSSFLVEGDDLLNLKTAKKVLTPGGWGSVDNGYAGISGVHRHTNGKLYAFYHAEDHQGMPSLGPGRPNGYYATVAVAESSDGGHNWTKLGPVIVSAKTKDFKAHPNHNARGVSLPGITVDRSGKYLYLYYTDQSFSNPGGNQTCVARADLTAGPPVPGSFSKYFQGSFSEPGIGGQETHVLSAAARQGSFAMYANPSYVSTLDRYIAVFNILNRREHLAESEAPKISGIYLAHSQDGINWSEPTQLIADYATFFVGKSVSVAGTILWDNAKAANGWLVYGYSPSWGHDRGSYRGTPHHMVGRRIGIELPVSSSKK